jgi:hypothetical protein
MAIETTWMLQDLARFAEQRDRSCLVRLLSHCRRNKGQSANGHKKADDHISPPIARVGIDRP